MEASTNTLAATYAFGEQQLSNDTPFNPWQCASKRLDLDTGFIDFGKRHYDPTFGRWLSLDPAGFINSTNLYQFNFNNPFRYSDPDGRFVPAIPLITVTFDLVITWISAEVVIGTAATSLTAYAGYKIGQILNQESTSEPPPIIDKEPTKPKKDKPKLPKFPCDPEDFLPDLSRNEKGRIYPADNIRIRPETHELKPGETYNPRHHGQHYHVEAMRDPTKGWTKNENIEIIKPPGYQSGHGTGFIPGEIFPGTP